MSRVIDDCPCCGAPLRPQEASCAYCGARSHTAGEPHDTEALDAFSALNAIDRATTTQELQALLVPSRQLRAGMGYGYLYGIPGTTHRLPQRRDGEKND